MSMRQMKNLTIADCLEKFEKENQRFVISNGKVIATVKENIPTPPTKAQ